MWPHLGTPDTIALISAIAAIASAIATLFGLLISRRANRIASAGDEKADKANQIAAEGVQKAEEANRIATAAHELAQAALRIYVKSERGEDYLILSPSGSEQIINDLTMFFPAKVKNSPITLASGNLRLFDSRIVPAFLAFWDANTPEIPGSVSVRENVPLPVVITVQGISRGVAIVTTGIYYLYVKYSRFGKESSLSILSLVPHNYAPTDDPRQLANRILDEIEAAISRKASPSPADN